MGFTEAVAIALAAELQQLAQGPSPKGLILENTPGQLSGLVGSRVGGVLVGTCLFYCFWLVGVLGFELFGSWDFSFTVVSGSQWKE